MFAGFMLFPMCLLCVEGAIVGSDGLRISAGDTILQDLRAADTAVDTLTSKGRQQALGYIQEVYDEYRCLFIQLPNEGSLPSSKSFIVTKQD